MEQEAIEGYRLSPQQEYLWRLCQQYPDAYRTQCALRFEGELHKSFLKEALQQVVEQHEILRTGFRSMPGMTLPLQVILEQGTWSWREVDLQQFAEQEQASQLAALERSESQRAFNHEQGEVLSACFVLLAPARHVLLLNISPLCADSWSLQNLVRELGRRYTARLSGAEAAGAEVALEAVQYADFSEWQHKLLNTEDSAGGDFWRKQNLSNMPVLKLPLEKDAGEEYRPESITLKSDAALAPELEALAQTYDVSLSELLLAAWSSLWWRLTSERELVVGAAVDGGRYKELHDSLGLFTKYLPVPLRFTATSSFQDIIKRVTASYREACRRQEYYTPGEGRAAEEGLGYEYEEREETVAGYGALRVEVMSEESCRSRQRVLLQCRYQRAAQRLELRLRYDGGCYSAAVIKLLAERFETWLQAVVRAPRAELSKVTLLGKEERGLLREWGTGAALKQVEARETLGQMLEQQARERGETAAVVGVEDVLTFSELNARANQLGRYLRQRGVGPEAVVGILLERSTRMVECVCGVWKAGGAYLPLHPGTPTARLAQVLKQAGVRLVLSEQGLTEMVAGTGVEVIEWEAIREVVSAEEVSEPKVEVSGENLAYVIYTSGSTGEPKGVMIEQRSVLHLLGGLRQEVYEANDERCVRVGLNAPMSFDASVKQLVQMLRGKTLVVIPEELRLEAGPLLSYLAQREVEVLDCTPAQLRLLRAEAGAGAQWPRVLLIGGEAIDGELWQQLDHWDETESINLYGPTEATVDTTWKRITGPGPTIGRPLPQVRVYLLDQHGEQVVIGQVGEVYIGGAGVGRGYLHAAGLTAERFVPDGYGNESGGRLYRTGDLARYTTDGELEYVGRTDRQVKLRGFRLELEEVEAALLEHAGVKAAAVVRHDEEKEERLVAYVVPKRASENLREVEQPLPTAKLEEQVVNGSALYQLPNRLEVFHHNRNETEFLYQQIFENQFYLRRGISIEPGDCIFDVGANIGLFTLFVYHQVRNASVYSFEPIPSNFDKLRNNVALYGLDVNLFNCGLSDREGTATFTFYPNWSACSGVYANVEEEEEALKTFLINQGESVAEYADELIEGRYEGEQVVCQLRTLSEVIRQHDIERIDLLKLDVEKSEWDVLKGIEPKDWQKIRQVVVEVHDLEGRLERMQQLLAEQGFVVEVEQEAGLVGTNIFSLYARRSEAAAELSEARSANGNGNGTARLWRESVAFGVAAAEVSEAELRSYLRERLPEYMVPQVLVKLERMPLSRHGKIDYQRLPAPVAVAGELRGEAARNEVEKMLAGIWSDVLGLVRVGRDENFFELGGHSLLATQVISRVREVFSVELRLRELFERPTVEKLAQSIERELRQGAGVSAPPIEQRERVGELPLSFAQQRLWFIDQLEPGGVVYNVPVAVRLQGSLNQASLAQTLTEVIRRHEVLRTRFDTVAGQAVQVIEAAAPVELAVEELSALEVAEREARVREWAAQEAATPFDLSRGPLLRVKLLRLAEQEHVVLLTMHHIVSDGWSVGVLIKEVGTLYAAYVAGEESPLEELPIQYADFALWQRAYLQGEVLDQQLDYWRRQLSNAPRLLDIPSDHPRPAVRSFRGAVARFELDQELSARLRALSQRESVTLFMLLLAAFKVLLLKYSGQTDIVIGADVANRNRAETENLIGFFVNMLVLRTELSGDPTFSELLQRVREVCLAAYAHQDLPFEKLVEELQPERSLSYAPLFQVVFALQNAPTKDLQLPELTLSTVETESDTAKFDLILSLLDADKRLVCNMEYSTDLFEAETINRLLGHFQTLLAAIVADPAQRLSRLPLLTEEEEQQLAEWNNTSREYPREACIHQLFEAQMGRTPEAVAVSFKDQQLSYRELNHRANRLAHYLQGLGVGPEVRVGVGLERSVDLVVALVAVLKAGGAYVPLDPSYPQERLAFMLDDAQARVLLTQSSLAEKFNEYSGYTICLDAVESEEELVDAVTVGAENLAYVIYTSGSTGQPKGVAVTHRAIHNLVRGTNYVTLEESDVVAQVSNSSFDAATFEIWGALLSGARLVIIEKDVALAPHALAAQLEADGVTAMFLTTALFNHMARELPTGFKGLRHLLFGGEAVEPKWVREVLENGRPERLLHVYGPTETTTFAMWQEVTSAGDLVPIGRPLTNVQIYLLDEHLRPVPVGVPGGLYVGGCGLARGYLDRPALTAERFIPDPFSSEPGARLYQTGDLARFLTDGCVDFLGRSDQQVKIRGFRVEPGEVEALLSAHPHVAQAAVVAREDRPGERRLVAYFVAKEGQTCGAGELRRDLAARLPVYMVPQVVVQLERLPLTANGKVDRRALPAVEDVREETEMVAAQTAVEEVLVGIWSELLDLARVGREENFFELGGHSLLATQVMSRVREAFRVELPLRELFEQPTLKELGQSIERELRQGAAVSVPPIERRERVEELPLSFAQQRLWFIDQLAPGGTVYNIPLAVRLSGALNVMALEQTLNEIIKRHEVLRTSFALVDEQPVQVIAPAVSLSLAVEELTSLPEPEREAEVLRLAEVEAHQPFDLNRGPLLRVKLWQLSESEHVVLLTLHHIIADGWSMGVLINEVALLYRAFAAGEPAPLPELPVQYADFALWQRERLQGEELERQLSYWRQQLAEAPALLALPTDQPRPPLPTFNGADEAFSLSVESTQALHRLSRTKDVTLFMTLLAVWQVLLQRYSGQHDIVVGTSMANRNRAETEGLIGFFFNMLVLRTNVSGDPTFLELLNRVKEVCLGAYAHQDLPFEKLVEELQPERSLNHSPLFQVVFVLQNAPMGTLELPGLVLSTLEQQSDETQFELILNMQEAAGKLSGIMGYNTDLFEAETIKRMLGHFQTLLAAVIADPAQQLSRLQLLTEQEEQQLAEWNNTTREYPRDTCIHQLFEAQVERTPEAVAVSFKDQQLSYRELNHRANQLAHHLQKLGVEPGARVGIYLEHSLETLVAILGVLKAGAAYVPIDPEHPIARRNFMIEDAQIAVLLTETGLAEGLATMNDTRLLCLNSDWEEIASESEQNPSPRATAEDLAYVIYTSGSTGTPKGVKIQHRALVNYIWWAKDVYVQDEKLDFPLYSSLAFDLTVTSIFTPLLTGNRVVVYRPDRWQSSIAEILKDDQVGVLKLTPSHLSLIKDADNSQCHIKRLIVGGEAFESELARQVYESFGGQVEIFNEYGPTEATVGCMIHRFDPAQVELASVPIGRPAANVQIYLLDEQLLPVPENVVGEVYISGDGLAAGYLNRDELTAESFICNPFRPEQRMYRTKDLARWLPDHEIDYIGRKDEQVKFHGYRVELNEIRSVLNGYPGVRDSVVLVRKKPGHGNDLMIAYYAARQEIEPRLLRDFMAQSIIKETIPNVFVHLKKLPLTMNGKVNLKALPDIEESRLATKHQYQATRTPIEAALATIWEEILSVRQVGLDANFFELGGHSLLVTQVVSRVREAFGVEVGMRELFERPTVKELGRTIERELRQGAGVSAPPIERRERVDELPLSFAQQRLWFIDQLEPGGSFYNVPAAVRLKGGLNQAALEQTLTEVIRRHEVLRTRFDTVDGRAVQVIEAAAPVKLAVEELSELELAEREARVREWAAQEATTPFDLNRGPLLRVKLLRLGEQEHVALLTMHHIVIDGWSLATFIREIATLYEAFIEGRPSPLPEPAIQYADFALWQRAYLQGEVLEQQLKYWREQLTGAETVLKLPTDKPRPAIYSYRGAAHRFVLPTAVTAPLRKLSQKQGCTLFMTLLASFKTLLYRYTEQEDILVGTAIANRNRSETEALIGFFVNTLVLRTDLSGNPSFRKLMQRVRETTLGAYVHQDMPFEKLVEELQPERSLSQAPLFQVAFGVQNTPSQTLTLPGLELSQMDFDFDTGRFDLTLWISEYQDELSGVWYYNTDLFEGATIKRMHGHFETILQNALAQPDLLLSEIEMLSEDEKKQELVQKQERLESNAHVLRTIRRKGISVPPATGAQTDLTEANS